MSKKLTPWFPAGTKPARKGVYETPSFNPARYELYQHWNGEDWGGWSDTVEGAAHNRHFRSKRQDPSWRGLSKEPK